STLAAAGGALIKLGPAAAWPLWARRSGRPASYLVVAGGLTALALLPVWRSVPGIPPGLEAYAVSWEFNGPLFEPLWRGLDAAGADARVKGGLDRLKNVTGEHEAWNRWYPFVYPRLLAKVLLAALALGVWVRSWFRGAVAPATGELFGGLLLCSATLYPWYLLWVLPWAALYRRRAWLWASLALPFSYLVGLEGMALWPWLYLGIWAPFLGFALWQGSREGWGWAWVGEGESLPPRPGGRRS
ncbi:MAG: hypothetical protein R3234_11595, partial [Thermoanaerobaculia bacterium]|nr:hypothetical protein [Thermoanaerobaculia bacterium]